MVWKLEFNMNVHYFYRSVPQWSMHSTVITNPSDLRRITQHLQNLQTKPPTTVCSKARIGMKYNAL